MSREKECKCCHEWWYASVIKEDLCPNCYDYFKQLYINKFLQNCRPVKVKIEIVGENDE